MRRVLTASAESIVSGSSRAMVDGSRYMLVASALFVQPVGQHVSGWRLTQQLGDPTDIDWLITLAKNAGDVMMLAVA
jgi:hypothetical protein